MNTARLRTKRVILPAVASVAVLAVGGMVWAASADDVSVFEAVSQIYQGTAYAGSWRQRAARTW